MPDATPDATPATGVAAAPDTGYPRLLADIGGTNARFAWQAARGEALGRVCVYPCAHHDSLLSAIRHYLVEQRLPPPRMGAIGIANPVTGDHVQMTNHHWSFSIEAMRTSLSLSRFLVLNDFTALALSLPLLAREELRQVGGGQAVANAAIGLIGPGTGLGVSGLWAGAAGPALPINGEGGHVTLAAADASEEGVLALLRRRFGHCSAERAVSGPGLVHLHQALCELDGVAPETLHASDISHRALAGDDPRCVLAVDLFFSFLGNVAGNLALTLGARGGIYIGGGIVPRLGARIDSSRFRERFEQKGRFSDYLRAVPTYVVQASLSPALTGAARALDDL